MAQPLKVLFVIDSLGTGGTERHVAEIVPHLARFNVKPVLVALRRRDEGVQQELQRQGFDVRILGKTGLLSRVLALRRIIRTERPDLIRTVLFHANLSGRLAALGTGTALLSALVSTDYAEARQNDHGLNRVRFRLARWLDSWTARYLTTHIHANSNAVKAAAVRDLRIPAEKITVLEPGRDPARLGKAGPERRRRARIELGLADDDQVLVNVGRQDYPKGQCYLLEAMGALVRAHPRLVLLVAGRPGDMSADLERLHRALRLGPQVRFLGHRTDIPEILAAADLFVFPSLYEGLPGAVMEAMALGLPIIASNIDAIREIVQEGCNATLVAPAATADLASAIEALLRDRGRARRFGQCSRRIFEERFTLERSMAPEVQLFHEVLTLQRASA